jgi:hypothetical protein
VSESTRALPGANQIAGEAKPVNAGVPRLRLWLFWVLVFGFLGTETELLLLEHYEDPWQYSPLVLIPIAIAALVWHSLRAHIASLRTLQIAMALIVISGFAGLALHFRGAAGFALELDPSLDTWNLTKKVLRAKAPPLLAPGVMMQLGLVGLAYSLAGSRYQRSHR